MLHYDKNKKKLERGRERMKKAAEETIEQDCAMRHIIIFQKQALERRQADLAEPCQTCKYASECKYDWFRKISNALPKATEKITLVHQVHQDILDSDHIGHCQDKDNR